jgi:putative ABC transport system permease protein
VIRHLLKLVWKRKRANALLIVEIFASFLVLFAVCTLAAAAVIRWRTPVGFDYHNVWTAAISFPPENAMPENEAPKRRAAVDAMLREARNLGPVESVGADQMPPYGRGTWISGVEANGHPLNVTRDVATDGFGPTMNLPLLAGRWFSADDAASPEKVVVVDADVARALFGSVGAAVGKIIGHDPEHAYRVVGVIAPYRKDGELSKLKMYMVFDRAAMREPPADSRRLEVPPDQQIPRALVIRVRPGTPAEFEETLIKRLHAVAPDYMLRVQHMEQSRQFMNRLYLAPALVLGIVAAFLIIMVALGLSGVLWQSVTRRTREIGLRRAVGATSREVHRQILAEVALLSTVALVVGVIVVVQLPLLGHIDMLTPASFAFGLAAALATVYAITLLCGIYPSWLAGRVQPAQALHYE